MASQVSPIPKTAPFAEDEIDLLNRVVGTANPIQRAWRDIHAVSAHVALTWDTQATQYGGVLLGKPPTDPKL